MVVQKYGGSSVATAERIKNVAARIKRRADAGDRVVAVVSAMGDTTDDLIALAHQITGEPEPREMDVRYTGEMHRALMVMARTRSASAISLPARRPACGPTRCIATRASWRSSRSASATRSRRGASSSSPASRA
jgi:aspartate kinase